jgi:UDP-N-acetylglucosamine diphosphorylase / glucose-1-phosphate thymidylyltransferase / UDP-N-acetylgalactosamine diphosphorylase / glucosamine-1-phosphate N-acetyltransferase / galactosamine-1-phosphate N-acetyltransferase
MISLADYIKDSEKFRVREKLPWEITSHLQETITALFQQLDANFNISNDIAIHKSAIIENSAVIKSPAIIGAGCYIGNNALLRGGVFLSEKVIIGSGCEIKTSLLFSGTSVAHFNFIGDSIIGSGVNIEAGAVIANHLNERENKIISVTDGAQTFDTGVEKFGAVVGDHCKIGANAVLSPGTLLKPGTIVGRLELIRQL